MHLVQTLLAIAAIIAVYGRVTQQTPAAHSKRGVDDEEVLSDLCGLTKEDEQELEEQKQVKALDRHPQEENRGLFGGDIELTEAQKELIKNSIKEKDGKVTTKEVVREEIAKRWPRGKPIPYTFADNLDFEAREMITKAINHIQQFTCVEFKYLEYKPDAEFMLAPHIFFYDDKDCRGPVGMRPLGNKISIGDKCKVRGIIVHEIMHSFGFIHEHNREDRDEYVEINTDNMELHEEELFEKGKDQDLWRSNYPQFKYSGDSFGVPYDFNSMMHYGLMQLSKDKKTPTIILKEKWRKKCDKDKKRCMIGQRHGLSKSDAKKINLLFGCPEVKKAPKKSECPIYHDRKDFLFKTWPKVKEHEAKTQR